MGYIGRHIDTEIKETLDTFGAIIIEGPKWCGKTTTAKRFAKSTLMLSDPTNDFENRSRALLDPKLAITGKMPRLLDEWQEVSKLWDAVRFAIDEADDIEGGSNHSKNTGMFILTGSATPNDSNCPMHTGTGRFARVKMSTMTLQEMGRSSCTLSVSSLSSNPQSVQNGAVFLGGLSAESIAETIVRGGWPGALNLSTRQAAKTAKEYISAICETDITKIDNVKRDPQKVRALMFSLARNESTYASLKTITQDVNVASRQTLSEYIALLQRMYVCDEIPAWYPALRTPVKTRVAKKLHLADASLAVAALGANVNKLLDDFKTLGTLFESFVLHDLKVYAQRSAAQVFQYHDSRGLEVDAIIEFADGSWIPVEIKLGAVQCESAMSNLDKLEKKMVAAGNKAPICKMVVYGFGTPAHMPKGNFVLAAVDTLCE